MQLVPHERNRGFTWQERRGPFRRLRDDEVRSYDEQGFVVLEDVFDAATVAEVAALLDPMEAQVEAFLRTREDGRLFIARADEITFTVHAAARSRRLREFCSGSVFRDLCFDLVGPDVRLYWDQAVYKKPGTEAPFPWHQDNGYTYVEPQQYLTCWVALTDASEENGCPWVLPGLHRRGTLRHRVSELGWVCVEDPEGMAVPAPVRAGGIVVFSSLTPHATGPNRSSSVRKSYIVQFAPEGAMVHGDGEPVAADAPERQFSILVGGEAPRDRDAVSRG